MVKLIKLLLVLAGLMIALTLLILADKDLGGIIAFFPLTVAIFLTVAILLVSFISTLDTIRKRNESTGLIITYGRVLVLLGVPALGYYYATHGENRQNLLVLSKLAFLVGIAASIFLSGQLFGRTNIRK